MDREENCLIGFNDFGLFVLFGFYITFNNLSVILQQCLDVVESSLLTIRVLTKISCPRHMT